MITTYPLMTLHMSHDDEGDRVTYVIAQGAGIPERERGDLFDAMRAHLRAWGYHVDDRVSLSVAEPVYAMPCSLSMMAETFARKVVEYIDAECREAA